MLQIPPQKSQRQRQRRLLTQWFPDLDVRNPLLQPVYYALAWVWKIWLAIWRPATIATVAAALVKVYVDAHIPLSEVAANLTNILTSSFIVRLVNLHPIEMASTVLLFSALLLLCRQANSALEREKRLRVLRLDYVVERVHRLQPTNYLSAYRSDIPYIGRALKDSHESADGRIRNTLHHAAMYDHSQVMGVLVIGGPAEGKTRTAWEAIYSDPFFANWWFVRWAKSANRPILFDFDALSGLKVIVWLDDLNLYANAADSEIVRDLVRRFALARVRSIVFVTTCKEGEDLLKAQGELDDLCSCLRGIQLGPISAEEARRLSAQLARDGTSIADPEFTADQYLGFWDGHSPGSIVFGVKHLPRRVQQLTEHAREILYSLQLIASAEITPLDERVVRAVCDRLYGWPHTDDESWIQARTELQLRRFIEVAEEAHQPVVYAPVADVFLQPMSLPPSPRWGEDPSAAWRDLYQVLVEIGDIGAVVVLGNTAYGRKWTGKKKKEARADVTLARLCYRYALNSSDSKPGSAEHALCLDLYATSSFAAANLYGRHSPQRIRLLDIARTHGRWARDAYLLLEQQTHDSLYARQREHAEELVRRIEVALAHEDKLPDDEVWDEDDDGDETGLEDFS